MSVKAKKSITDGPCYLKLLVNNLVAGAIIGKNGTVISQIEEETGCVLKLSPSNHFYPGTQERVVALSGPLENVNNAAILILSKVRELAANVGMNASEKLGSAEGGSDGGNPNRIANKVVVPRSTVSAIIGKAGGRIKEMEEQTGTRIQISNREMGLNERVITISGTYDQVHNATLTVVAAVQDDSNLKENMYVSYVHGGLPNAGGPIGFGGVGAGGLNMGAGVNGSNVLSPMGGGSHNVGGHFGAYGNFGGGSNFSGNGAGPGQGGVGAGGGSEMLPPTCEIILQVPDASIGAIIGRNGSCLSDICSMTGAKVQISQKGEFIAGTSDRRVSISGPVNSVHNAHIIVLQKLESAQLTQKVFNGSGGSGNAGSGVGSGVNSVGGNVGMASSNVGGSVNGNNIHMIPSGHGHMGSIPQQQQIMGSMHPQMPYLQHENNYF